MKNRKNREKNKGLFFSVYEVGPNRFPTVLMYPRKINEGSFYSFLGPYAKFALPGSEVVHLPISEEKLKETCLVFFYPKKEERKEEEDFLVLTSLSENSCVRISLCHSTETPKLESFIENALVYFSNIFFSSKTKRTFYEFFKNRSFKREGFVDVYPGEKIIVGNLEIILGKYF